jgi:hypothetical protein
MTEVTFPAGGNLAADETRRIAAQGPYGGRLAPTDEEAAAIVRARGHSVDPQTGRSTYTTPARTADAYSGVNMDGAPLPAEVDPVAATERARDLGLALQLDPVLAGVVGRDLAHAGQVNPDAVRAAVEKTPHSYDEMIKLVDAALGRAAGRIGKPVGLKAADLPIASFNSACSSS